MSKTGNGFYFDFKSNSEKNLKWEQITPREPLKPVFSINEDEISVEGNGNSSVFGYWQINLPIEAGKTYNFRVKFRVAGIDDINLHVLNLINWRIEGSKGKESPHDQITHYSRQGEYIIGEQSFKAADHVTSADIQLGLRYVKNGKVSWSEASLSKCEQDQANRMINVTTVRWRSLDNKNAEINMQQIDELLEQAGALNSDIVLLPEFTNFCAYDSSNCDDVAESIPDGKTCLLLSEKAKKHRMNVCAGIVERDGDILYNTAVMFDRSGHYVGKYRKVHLYWPEAIFYGETPGDEHPVFDLDIGRVGVIICYDIWYPESVRILALKGAELILFPTAGYELLLLPARAIDNGVYVAVSSLNTDSAISNTHGRILAQTSGGIITARINLADRSQPHANAGGNLNSAPGGRRGVRNSMSNKIYKEIQDQVDTWLSE